MKGMVRAALWGAVIAGTLDIVYAIVFYGPSRGVAAIRILQSVASGLLGAPAYRGGVTTALLGLALHFAIMFVMAFPQRGAPATLVIALGLLGHVVLVGIPISLCARYKGTS